MDTPTEDVLVHRRVRLHLAVDDERGVALSSESRPPRDLLRFRMAHDPKLENDSIAILGVMPKV